MHSFSINTITGDSADYSYQYGAVPQYPVKQEYLDTGDSQTPSPSDSGIAISYSPTHSDASTNDVNKVTNPNTATRATLSHLSKTSEALVKPEVSHEKPQHSCIALISMAIQSSPDGKLLLGDIYRYIMDNFPFYNNQQRAWRNNIRYTLSINGCFLKAGRSDCGKGNYWAMAGISLMECHQYGAVPQYQPSYPPGQPDYQFPVKQEYLDAGDSQRPSTTDSGIDISYSSRHSFASTDDVNKTLSHLSKTSEALVKPEVSHEKTQHSCIALISMAIQSSPDGKLLLSDIYRYIMDNFPYNNQQRAWRNNIRYTLSINGCFLKAGGSDCGKGNYWAIHPAVAHDFAMGDYSRRQSSRCKLRNTVKSCSGNVPAQKPGGFVAGKVETNGYHPYNTGARYHS